MRPITLCTNRVLLIMVLSGLVVLLAQPAEAAWSRPTNTKCAETERVVNHGRPLPWAQDLFAVLKIKKYRGAVPKIIRAFACTKDPNHPQSSAPGALDYHRTWDIKIPNEPTTPTLQVVAGVRGVMLIVGTLRFYTTRCVLEKDSPPLAFTIDGVNVLNSQMDFYGLANNDVVVIQASGGTGTRTGDDGQLLPIDAEAKPIHNVYHLHVPNGAARLTFVRRNKPSYVINLVGPGPRSSCPSVAEEEHWTVPKAPVMPTLFQRSGGE